MSNTYHNIRRIEAKVKCLVIYQVNADINNAYLVLTHIIHTLIGLDNKGEECIINNTDNAPTSPVTSVNHSGHFRVVLGNRLQNVMQIEICREIVIK